MAGQKLPLINYNTMGVSTLGRHDIAGPARVDAAKYGAINAGLRLGGDIYDAYERSEVDKGATISSSMTEQMAELNARIKNTKVWKADDLDEMDGVEYVDTEVTIDENGMQEENFRENIPSYEVAEQIYKTQADAIKNAALSKVSGKGAEMVERTYAQLYKEGIGHAVNHQIAHYQEAEQIRMFNSYEDAVKSGNMQGAQLIAMTAKENNVWTATEYNTRIKALPDRVATAQYITALDQVTDAKELEKLQGHLVTNQSLKNASKISLHKMYEAKITRINNGIEKKLKEEKTMNSAKTVMSMADTLAKTKTPLPLDELQAQTAHMTATDVKLMAGLNNNLYVESDPTDLRELTVMVKQIALPSGKTTYAQRRDMAIRLLTEAVDEGKVSTDDFVKLWDGINTAQAFEMKNPHNKQMVELLWKQLTGGARDIMSSALSEGGVHVQLAVEAELDMMTQMEKVGPSFNAREWWAENKTHYFSQSVSDNLLEIEKHRAEGVLILKQGSNTEVDYEATMKALRQKEKNGTMTREEVNETFNRIDKTNRHLNDLFNTDPKLKEQFSR